VKPEESKQDKELVFPHYLARVLCGAPHQQATCGRQRTRPGESWSGSGQAAAQGCGRARGERLQHHRPHGLSGSWLVSDFPPVKGFFCLGGKMSLATACASRPILAPPRRAWLHPLSPPRQPAAVGPPLRLLLSGLSKARAQPLLRPPALHPQPSRGPTGSKDAMGDHTEDQG